MAHADDRKHWEEDERFYSSGSHSDDSPILSYRYDKRRHSSYTCAEERERRSSTLSVFTKFCMFCAAMILFCVLMYIPVYSRANYHLPKGMVSGWSVHTNRDTKIYVQPNNVTTIYEPKEICTVTNKKKLLLLIVVCSSTSHFDRRNAIRQTWGDSNSYKISLKVFLQIREKYKNYDYKKDLYPTFSELQIHTLNNDSIVENATAQNRVKRDFSGLNKLLPVLARALNNISLDKVRDDININNVEENNQEKRFEDDDDPIIPEFDMNKEIGGRTEADEQKVDYDNYDYQSNIMRIPPKGEYFDNTQDQDLTKVLTMLKQAKDIEKIKNMGENSPANGNIEPEFKVVFLLGLPSETNKTMQRKIEEEVNKYGDVIQEGFIDSYNNLTLKSIMMLKWVTNKCNDSVRYILKTDDDMYINVPNLMLNLKNISEDFDKKLSEGRLKKEYLLIGDLISGARPVLNAHNKWYSPRYMYSGRVYPRYLSGTGYVMSMPTARALYSAALTTNYFHLEDIYITGMCSLRASPRITPRDSPLFTYAASRGSAALCCAHARATAHRVTPHIMRNMHIRLQNEDDVDRCERIRLTQVRRDRLRRLKVKPKKLTRGLNT